MRVFGPISVDPSLPSVRTPVGEKCLRCGEAIGEGDSGVIIPHLDTAGARLAPQHRECFLRSIAGSVGHQLGLCSCDGGPGAMDDPPDLTPRQAARAAVDLWHTIHDGRA